MNQSNKALREEITRLFFDITAKYNQRITTTNMWHILNEANATDQILALVTNHIKDKMPEKIVAENANQQYYYDNEQGKTPGMTYQKGYNQALDEVSQLINELGEVK